jgi:thiol-disulfide isomerase/thioredoxin
MTFGTAFSRQNLRILDFQGLQPFLNRTDETVYVINFWATWCGPCRVELPDIEKIHLDYKDKNVKVLLVSLDFPSAVEKSLIPFLKTNNISAEVLLLDDPDGNSWIGKVDPSWSGALPATLIYKKDKRYFYGKMINYQTVENALNALISGTKPDPSFTRAIGCGIPYRDAPVAVK